MTPERHEQIASLFYRAVTMAPAARAGFLDTACAGDSTLRREVDSLLSLDETSADFMEMPAWLVLAGTLHEESVPLPAGSMVGFYRVLSSLGSGGMGEVYLAEDTRLGRKIALKLLPERFTQEVSRLRRFEQEARAASALNHPNIITIHDIGDAEGLHFIAAEFINGETVRQRIAHRRMTLDEVLDVTLQAANALAAAHEAGVVHRDIKPENIMLRTDGYVKVLDFGLAKLTQDPEQSADAADIKTGAPLTTTTTLIGGTVKYMSPEQALGQRVDARSDIFSLGVVLYEMLAGRVPFAGENSGAYIEAILNQDPPLDRDLPEASKALKEIVSRCLRKDRAERYQTARELVADLKLLKQGLEAAPGTTRATPGAEHLVHPLKRHRWRALAAVAVVLLAALGLLYYFAWDDTIDSIAVLPFVNQSNDPDREFLSDGIADNIINNLYQQFPNLRVVPLAATQRYKGKPDDIQTAQTAGRDLTVRAVLMGRMAVKGDALSVSADLVDARDGRLLWREQYNDGRISQSLRLQDEIWQDFSDWLRRRLAGPELPAPTKPETENNDAYNLKLLGRMTLDQVSPARLKQSIEFFEQAVKLDPNYAEAYSGLADAYSLLGEGSAMRPVEAFTKAKEYADEALRIKPSLADALVSRGVIRLYYDWDWEGAKAALSEARRLNGSNPQVNHFYGHYLQITGRTDEAVTETQQGLDKAATWLFINAELAYAYYLDRQYDLAIGQANKTLALGPGHAYALWTMAQAYELQQKYQDALNALKKAEESDRDWSWIVADRAWVFARTGRTSDAKKILRDLERRASDDNPKKEYIDPVLIAYIHLALGDKDQAIAWLRKAYEIRSGNLVWLRVDPKLDNLQDDPRFVEIVKKMNLL
jgi:serine/threonine-protein kinase